MIRLLATAAALLLTGTSAGAYCPSYPDDASSGYVANNTSRAVCLQYELGKRTDALADEAHFDAAIGNLELELQRQRQTLATPPQLPYAWPEL